MEIIQKSNKINSYDNDQNKCTSINSFFPYKISIEGQRKILKVVYFDYQASHSGEIDNQINTTILFYVYISYISQK
jgi:hypothetical protein